jgi:hypothetical protein
MTKTEKMTHDVNRLGESPMIKTVFVRLQSVKLLAQPQER